MMVELNVYQKLSDVRILLQQKNLKMSGKNKFAGYSYFELGDFLPTVTQLFHDAGIVGVVKFDSDNAELLVIDVNDPSQFISFTSPMSSANLKGCHDVQNLGAVHKYLRRYLYINALEVAEHDGLEPTVDPKKETANNTIKSDKYVETGVISEGQVTRLCTMLTNNKWDVADFDSRLLKKYNIVSKKLIPKTLYDEICAIVEGK